MSPNVTLARIEDAYRSLGYKDGWRFMSCPEANFVSPKVLLVTLNPGGGAGLDVANPEWSQERGSAYICESWGKFGVGRESLQTQIQRLFEMIGRPLDEAASAYFIPFRSSRFGKLPNKVGALSFAQALWMDVLEDMQPEYVVCIGNTVTENIGRILNVRNLVKRPTGWGNVTLSVGSTESGARFIGLPHLGTYKLFSNDNCIPFLRVAFGLESSE